MSNSPRPNRSWTVISFSLLSWILLLSFGLSYFLGAGFSSGWLIAGGMISIAAICGVLVLKEILDALLSSQIYGWCERMLNPKAGHATAPPSKGTLWKSTGNLLDSSFSGSRRTVLGLRSNEFSSNRRRKAVKTRASSTSRMAGQPAY